MKAPRVAIALLALAGSLLPLTSADASKVPTATELSLPTPNSGLNQGYLPFQSCSSRSNCAITGMYLAAHGDAAGVIEYESKGVWQRPVKVSPPAGYSPAKGVTMSALVCPADGSCVALGQYTLANRQLPFVQAEVKGVWRKGESLALPDDAAVTNQSALAHAIACVGVGYCTVVGTYTTDSPTIATQGFILSQVKGVWRRPAELTLPAGANANPYTALSQIACWSHTGCAVVGSYVDTNNVSHAIVVPEIGGVWKKVITPGLPGSASAFAGAQFSEVDCVSDGSCVAAGTFNTATGAVRPLVAISVGGLWDRALAVNLPHAAPNPEALIYGFKGLDCFSAGNCAFGGQYLDTNGHYQGFFDNVVNGTVRPAQALILPAGALQAGHNGGVVSVSCPAVGACVAGAAYLSSKNTYAALRVSETRNVWTAGTTISLPNSATTVGVGGGVYSVQCFSVSSCQFSGSYQSTPSRYDGFSLVTSQ